MLFEILCLLCAVIIFIHIFYRYNHAGRLLARINGPKKLPLVGNMLDMCQTPEKLFIKLREWHKEHGHLYQLSGLSFRAVMLHRPEDIEVLLATSRYNEKALPYTFLQLWLGEGLLVSNGKKWLERRKMLTPAFHFNILMKFFKNINENTQDFVKSLEKEVATDKVDVIPLISKTTLRIMCETSMGTNIREDTPTVRRYLESIHTYGLQMMTRISKPWLYIDIIHSLSKLSRSMKTISQELHEFTKTIINERRQFRQKVDNVGHEDEVDEVYGRKSKLAMLDLLLDEERKGNIDDRGIREEVDTFLFEGHDTTATALSFMMMRLANEPVIQNLIFKELQSIFGDSSRPAAFEDLSKMKYLECCIKESLRLYPSVPFVSRYITQEAVIDNHRIPANTFIDIHIYDLHRNPAIYPEPEKFVPERFLPENTAKRHPYAYIPFSAGPRNCIGQKFALMELKTVMSGLLRRYRLEPITKPEDLVFMSDIVLRTNHPIYVRFCDRNNIAA